MATEKSNTAERGLIRIKEVMNISGLSRTALYLSIQRNDFPAPVKLSARAVAWSQNEVVAWIDTKMKNRTRQIPG